MSGLRRKESFETKAIHAGQEYDRWSNGEIVPPIVTTSTFFQNDPTNMQVNSSNKTETLGKCRNKLSSFQGPLL